MLLLWVLMAGNAIAGERRRVVADEGSGSKGKSYQALLGQGYRQLWGTSIEVDVLDLKTFAGGLRPVMRVGGLQTASLAMKGADRRNYTFRPLIKDASKLLPEEFRGTPVDDLIQDQMSAQNPVGAIIVSELSEAAGVLEAKQSLVVMPDDELLGEFREDYRGVLGTIAVYPSAGSTTNPGDMGASAIVSTHDMWSLYRTDPESRPDSKAYLRARLLDLFVGDWDRHEGQWRWAFIPGKHGLQPIAEDRDQALSNYDGLVMTIARLSGLPQFTTSTRSTPRSTG